VSARLEWRTQEETCPYVSPGGFLWSAYLDGVYFGSVYNDGWSSVDCDPIYHGSIHLAALRVQAAAERAAGGAL
jgi:hypothetical protein